MKSSLTLLVADDDHEDRFLIRDALIENRLSNDLRFVGDGEELLDYLFRRGDYSEADRAPRPGLILLDLNMPKKSGLEALTEIRQDPGISDIPVVILTTSKAEEDILRGRHLGVSAFITKPVTFEGLVSALRHIDRYWIEIVAVAT